MRKIGHDQGSELWLQWRMGGIGGSDAASIMGVSPWQTRDALLSHKLQHKGFIRATDSNKNSAQLRGTRNEPKVRTIYNERSGRQIEPACGIHDEYDWMRASFDGLSEDGLLALEIKCPKLSDHLSALEGNVPIHYWPQVQHLLVVAGCPKLHYVSWTDNKKVEESQRFSVVVVRPNESYIQDLLAEERKFVEELQALRVKKSQKSI